MMRGHLIIGLLLSLLLAAMPAMAKPGNAVKIESIPIGSFLQRDAKRTKFGKLEFLGGLELTSKDDGFGGLSGLRLLDEHKFIAVTDQGKWLTGEIVRDGDRPTAVEDARMGRLRAVSGKKLKGKRRADSEGIEQDGETYLISFERNHRVERFHFKNERLTAMDKRPLHDLGDLGLENNKGPEGIAKAADGKVVAFPENAYDDDGNYRAFLFMDEERQEFRIVPSGGFSLTDAAFLPEGDLLLLERRFSLLTGIGMRIRRFDGEAIEAGAVLEGTVLLSAGGDHAIDNMEGIAVSTTANGGTRLTVISDDNFSKRQRTLLLEFRLSK